MHARYFGQVLRALVLASLCLPLIVVAQGERSTISLAVDATGAPQRMLHSRESIPVRPGPLTLLYPKWIPGEHGPTGPVVDVAGIIITAGGKTVAWRRDLEEMFAIHCVVPDGVSALDVAFDFILPPMTSGFSSGASATPRLLVLSWNQVVMYPDTPKPSDILVTPSLMLPDGWTCASALAEKDRANATVHFVPVSLEMLVDSPVLCGVHLRRIDLTPSSGVPHSLDLLSDSEAALEIRPQEMRGYRNLVVEAGALFGGHHYDHYDFLFTLSDQVAHFGLEHHQSSDDRLGERTLLDEDLRKTGAGLLPHEFVHSWNGKYRRPAGLATGDFTTPMKDDLLWVYEGLTQYLGTILTPRSTLCTPEEYREGLALNTARLDQRPGRTWRPLQDVNDEAQLLYYARSDFDAWRRAVDFYDEGSLIWLEADVTIRKMTGEKSSLDDFCKAFYGPPDSGPRVKTYTFEDLVAAMNGVVRYDWRAFFTTRLQSLDAHAPMGGIEKSGWTLAYSDTLNAIQESKEETDKMTDLRFSLGVLLAEDGTMRDVIPGTPAAKAGISPGMKLVAVNGRRYSRDIVRDALKLGKIAAAPLELLCANGEFYATYRVDYHGGDRSPHLVRDASRPDVLTAIIAPVGEPQLGRKAKR